MNINPQAKRILCFGDSNTYGTIPYGSPDAAKERYPVTIRWTGVVQKLLWDWYDIIEEWRWWRTIYVAWTSGDQTKKWDLFLEWLLASHIPLDLVIVMLWNNDIKESLWLSPQQICDMMEQYIISQIIDKNIPLLLISPPPIRDGLRENFPAGSNNKITELNRLYKQLSMKHDFHYLDIQSQLLCGSDGVHLTEVSHQLFWEQVTKKIKELL